MCVIIAKNPGVEVPFNKLKNACRTNTDGFGLMTLKDGKFLIERQFEEGGNDPEKIARLLEPFKDEKVYLHLRFRTSGAKAIEAVHPFKIMDKKKDGADLYLMHNGTINAYDKGMTGLPDSYHYGVEVVKPLYDVWEHRWEGSPLDDPKFQFYLSMTLKSDWSRVLLLDSYGSEYIINKDRGKEFEWGWASNDSYFADPYVHPVTRRGSFRGSQQEAWEEYGTDDWSAHFGYGTDDAVETGTESVGSSRRVGSPNSTQAGGGGKPISKREVAKTTIQTDHTGSPVTSGLPTVYTAPSVRTELSDVVPSDPLNDDPPEWPELPKVLERKVTKETYRPRFLTAAGFKETQLKELCSLSVEDFEIIRDQYPDACVMLIMDLLELVYDQPVNRETVN
jgi:hypothetical protein